MKAFGFVRAVVGASALTVFAAVLHASTQAPAPAPARASAPAASGDVKSYQTAVVNRYCVTCHNDRLKTGNLSFDGVDFANAAGAPEIYDTLEKVVRKLRLGAMPPQGMPRPDEATMVGFVTTLESSLDRAAAARPNPGRTETFHRLNRSEYRNAVRDVLGVDIEVSDLIPQDESSFGFDNIAGVLKLSHTFMERYTSAATKIARLAIGATPTPPGEVTALLTTDLSQQQHFEGLPLGTRGGLLVRHWVPLDAEYEFTIHLLRNQGDYSAPVFDEEYTMELSVDGERVHVHTFPVRPRAARGRGGRGAGAPMPMEDSGEAVKRDEGVKVRVPLKAGPRDIVVTFPKKSSAIPPQTRNWFAIPWFTGVGYGLGTTTHAPGVGSVTVAGPFNPTGPGDTPSRRQILTCQPASRADEARCGRQILSTLARRAYRRPVTTADLQPLVEFFDRGRTAEGGTFERGVELAIGRMLVSPEFLFRIEREPSRAASAANYRISDVELASRLSFFLWSSIPDDALIAAAEKGTLRTPAVLRAQVRRMLGDSKSETFIRNFTGQWLYVRNVPRTSIDAATFPDFEAGLRRAYQRETELFFTEVLRNPNASALELLSADYTYLNEALANHYGIPNVYGERYRKVPLTGGERLGGLLGQGSILMATSHPNRTAPTIRGKFILGTFLGVPPPDPPPNVVTALPENQVGTETKVLTVRERLAEHRRNVVCAGCHNTMDPLGLALENFDAIGQWRTKEEDGSTIDPSVVLFDGTKIGGAADLRAALLKRRDNILRTITDRLMTYALGRGMEYYDQPAIRKIVREAQGQSLESLILGVVTSDPFQMRRAES